MGSAIVDRQSKLKGDIANAQARLRTQGTVTEDLLAKIKRAQETDAWRRGAVPLGDRLDDAREAAADVTRAVLIAADGSQIFPDRDAAALYFVINIGTIVFRVGSGGGAGRHQPARALL